MRHSQNQIASIALKLALPISLGAAFLAAIYIRFYSRLLPVEDLPAWPAYTAYFVLSFTLWSVLETRFGIIYKCFGGASLARWLLSLVTLDLLTLALVSSAAFFWRGYSFSRLTVALFWTWHVLLCSAAGWGARAWVRRRAGRSAVCIFLIGEGIDLDAVRRECVPQDCEVLPRSFPDAPSALLALENFEPPPGCREILVVVGSGQLPPAALVEALRRLPVWASVALSGVSFGEVHSTPSFAVFSTDPRAAGAFDYIFSKRLLDLAVSILSLLLLSPLLAAIALLIWIRSGRPVLLAQERVGRGGRRFSLYKFRTLPVSSLADGDRRWTAPPTDRWGRLLRSTGLDELPQLINVLRGEMSLVGPRPERPHFVEQFRRQLPFYSTRHRLQVGITGWAQVNGWRGDTSITQRVEHDLYYLRHWSLALDFRILWMTLADFFHRLRAPAATGGAANARSL